MSRKAEKGSQIVIYSGGKVKYLNKLFNKKNNANQALQAKNQDEVITQISKAYDQFALVIESKSVRRKQKRLDANKNC